MVLNVSSSKSLSSLIGPWGLRRSCGFDGMLEPGLEVARTGGRGHTVIVERPARDVRNELEISEGDGCWISLVPD